jgi:hypothetical protein
MSSPALPPSAYSFFPYSPAPLPGPVIYAPYNFYSSSSLPLLPSNHPGLPPRPPVTVLKHATLPYRTSTLPPRPAATKHIAPTEMATGVPRQTGEYKRKKPRTPRSAEEPPRAQRRKPLQRAAPLPAATAVTEALDDLEREVTPDAGLRGGPAARARAAAQQPASAHLLPRQGGRRQGPALMHRVAGPRHHHRRTASAPPGADFPSTHGSCFYFKFFWFLSPRLFLWMEETLR